MRVLIAALFSAALIWLVPQAPPAHLNKVVSPTAKAHTVQAKPIETRPQAKAQEKALTEPQKPTTPEQNTTAVTTSVVRPVAQGCDAYRSTFEQYAWNVTTALAVCKAESGGNVYALSSTGDRGLMQINDIHADMVNYDLSALYNPYTNIRVAYRVYLSQGWNGWSTYRSGRYLSYL